MLTRIRPGVLADTTLVAGLGERDRHELLIRASLPMIGPNRALSHLSALAVYGWPHVGAWPAQVHVTALDRDRTETTRWSVVHAASPPLPPLADATLDGVRLVDPSHTVVDLAVRLPFAEALVVVDHTLSTGTTTPASLDVARRHRPRLADTKVATVLAAGSVLSGSPAESLCRARLIELQAPVPVQQQAFTLPDGTTARVDFWFSAEGVVLEVDGRSKYEDEAMLRGVSTAQAHWHEKLREDAIRALPAVRAFVRVTWADLMKPERLRAKLRRAGVACR